MNRRRLIALALLATFSVSACEAGDVQLAKDFLQQWAIDHAGEIAAHKLGLPADDDYVGAAVDGAEVVMNLQQADALMAKGRKNSDPVAMDAALKLRPHDWSYELSRADLALRQNDVTTYFNDEAGAMHDSSGPHQGLAYQQEYRELVSVHKYLYARGHYDSYYQCQALYSRLSILGKDNLLPGGNASAKDQATWNERYARCDSLPR